MRVETIELLRCPVLHESSSLVTVAQARDGDRLTEGELGCAVCGAEFPLRNGVVYLSKEVRDPLHAEPDAARTAALLGLSEPGMRVALCGAFGAVSDAIEQATGAVCITVNASPLVHRESHADHLVIGSVTQLPFADASLSGIAIDAAHLALVSDAVRVLRAGGRVLAPVQVPVPVGLRELARDDTEWVAVVETPVSAPVGLRRGATALP